MNDRSSKTCVNAWYKFAAIFSVAALTLFGIFELGQGYNHAHAKMHTGNILIPVTSSDANSRVCVVFEQALMFLQIDEETNAYTYFSKNDVEINTLRNFIKQHQIGTLLSGTMSIDTYQILNSCGVNVYTGVSGPVDLAFGKFKRHELVSFSHQYGHQSKHRPSVSVGRQPSAAPTTF
ncbi:MAG: hypothetical protein HOE48_08505 [Candidatus Latescibacteria bacterium]|jgi:predicted Fe-Mo cluster-binding NifX family protein|nr:hypothetical protein [Candidatus Latescibacterota bacterium]MBT4137941.1 hypothetical protein [Candidatus Latescibacterota bacterium]MBT5830294.1 hypothetical protein [Candidatus Latescibacterota bacterium]